ncbi:MAG TPA: hypothetical protein VJN72_00770 [Gaiellales bacterium]|nr:hypothetical protein [Gaiellales bacterium]
MTMTANTLRWRIARYAIAGAILLNIVTVVWAFHASAGTIVIGAIGLGILGAALGAAVGWATAPNRDGRWWAQRRPRRRSVRTHR